LKLLLAKYHIYLKVWRGRLMRSHLSTLCELYNTLMDLRIGIWRQEHICPNCGEELPRDGNSAKPIKRIGLSSLKIDYAHGRWVDMPSESEPPPSLRGMVSEDAEAGSPQLKLWGSLILFPKRG
jgi:hypothetical protein